MCEKFYNHLMIGDIINKVDKFLGALFLII